MDNEPSAISSAPQSETPNSAEAELDSPDMIPSPGWAVHGLRWVRDGYRKFAKARLERQYLASQRALRDPALVDFLARYYECAPLCRGGQAYPVVALACNPLQSDFQSILGRLVSDGPQERFPDRDHVARLKRLGRTVFDRATYVLRRVVSEQPTIIECGLGTYFDAMESCDSLEWELLKAWDGAADTGRSTRSLARRFPLRDALRRNVADPLRDGSGRSAMLSTSTLIVYNDEGKGYRALLRWRSGRTAAHSDLVHVTPSGIFQPQYGDPEQEYDHRLSVFREYLEEIYGEQEFQETAGELGPGPVWDHPKSQELKRAIEEGRAHLVLTGYAMNLLNLRPELCSLLLIGDADWCRRDIRAGWEFQSQDQLAKAKLKNPPALRIDLSDRALAASIRGVNGTFVPPGAAAFWLGIDAARRLASGSAVVVV